MAIIPQPFLFSWKEIDEASDLDRLRLVLSALPDESLVCFLEQRRGRGRDDYPIRSMWNAVIAGVVFQHPSAAALLRELRRNRELRQLCGFNPFGGEASAPSDDAMERFLKLIVEHSSMLTGMFHELVDELKKDHKKIHKDTKELSADKGYDSAVNNTELLDEHEIKPVIDKRTMWRDQKYKTLYPERYDVFCYDETGKVYCACPSMQKGADELRELAFVGFEKDRNTLKYRCPSAAFGFECQGRTNCEKLSAIGIGDFGRVVRVPIELDRRIFTPIARPTDNWHKAYNLRTSVERVNGRIDQVLGFELHNIRGKAKMEMRVTLALVVMLATALGRIRTGQSDKMRSLTAPAARAA